MDAICGGVGGGFDNATALAVSKVENSEPTHDHETSHISQTNTLAQSWPLSCSATQPTAPT